MKKLGIILANCKGNIGDFAILHAMINHLSDRYPDSSIAVFPDPTVRFSPEYYSDFQRMLDHHVDLSDDLSNLLPGRIITSAQRMGRKLSNWSSIGGRLISMHSRSVERKLTNLESYEAIFVAGGGLWGANEIMKFGLIRALAAREISVGVYPFTAAWPMWKHNNEKTIFDFFSSFESKIYVREDLTLGRLKDIGVSAELMPDIAFYLSKKIQNIESAAERNPDRVLLSHTKRIMPNSAQLRKVGGASNLEKSVHTSEVLEELLSRRVPVELITTCASEDGREVIRLARRYSIPYWMPRTWQEFCSELKSSSCLVTNRLHGAILGIISETPILLIKDSDKVKGFNMSHPELASEDAISNVSSDRIKYLIDNRTNYLLKQKQVADQSFKSLNERLLPLRRGNRV